MRKIEMDGIKEAQPMDYQSFLARIIFRAGTLTVTIPKETCKYMKLNRGQLIEVAIRYIPIEEAKEQYGYIPTLQNIKTAICPKCGKLGTWNETNCCVVHGKKHGFTKRAWHYIPIKDRKFGKEETL